MTQLFLWTTVATSVTGFFFPFHGMTPGIVVGILSLIVLALAFRARGRWRKTYIVSSMLALYFNVFVLVVQSFEKVPALTALAPTQSEPPFQIAQAIVLIIFVILTIQASQENITQLDTRYRCSSAFISGQIALCLSNAQVHNNCLCLTES